jgi:hypothetical protein
MATDSGQLFKPEPVWVVTDTRLHGQFAGFTSGLRVRPPENALEMWCESDLQASVPIQPLLMVPRCCGSPEPS